MFIMYNIVNMVGRYYAVIYGYKKGIQFLNENQDSNIIQRVSSMANVVGLMVVGSLIASVIKLRLLLKFQ